MRLIWLYLCYALIFLKLVVVTSAADQNRSGPYRVIIMRIGTCKKISYRLHKDPPMKLTVDIYNTSTRSFLSRGNLTITRNVSNAKTKIKNYLWHNGKWKASYLVDSLGCNEMMMPMLCSLLNIKFDRKRCTFLKGNYHFENIDTNMISHLMTKTLEYGKTLWTCEIYLTGNPFQTLNCIEYETWVVPA